MKRYFEFSDGDGHFVCIGLDPDVMGVEKFRKFLADLDSSRPLRLCDDRKEPLVKSNMIGREISEERYNQVGEEVIRRNPYSPGPGWKEYGTN